MSSVFFLNSDFSHFRQFMYDICFLANPRFFGKGRPFGRCFQHDLLETGHEAAFFSSALRERLLSTLTAIAALPCPSPSAGMSATGCWACRGMDNAINFAEFAYKRRAHHLPRRKRCRRPLAPDSMSGPESVMRAVL